MTDYEKYRVTDYGRENGISWDEDLKLIKADIIAFFQAHRVEMDHVDVHSKDVLFGFSLLAFGSLLCTAAFLIELL